MLTYSQLFAVPRRYGHAPTIRKWDKGKTALCVRCCVRLADEVYAVPYGRGWQPYAAAFQRCPSDDAVPNAPQRLSHEDDDISQSIVDDHFGGRPI